MSDWLNDVIGEDLIAEYEGHYCTEDAVSWLRQKPRTIGESRAEEIDWLRWVAANTNNRDLLEKLSQDSDPDVRMWVACNLIRSKVENPCTSIGNPTPNCSPQTLSCFWWNLGG
jgi:hypothetical protein